MNHKKGAVSVIWSKILRIAGVKFEHQWNAAEYRAFPEANGWNVARMDEMPARITLACVECVKRAEMERDDQHL